MKPQDLGPVSVRVYGGTYINVQALRHFQLPLSKSPPACHAARKHYHDIRKRGLRPPVEPCAICAAVQAAMDGVE